MITIKDIAVLAETSTATVSRVLNNDPHVSSTTREKVLKVANASGYKLRTSSKTDQATNSILILLPSLENPYFISVLKGVEHSASASGYNSLVCVTHRDYKTEKRYLNKVFNSESDGAILFTTSISADEINQYSQRYNIIVCGAISAGSDVSYVSIDDTQAAYDATSYLIALGNEKIAFINGDTQIGFEERRHAGYVSALAAHGIPYVPTYEMSCGNHYTDSYTCTEQLLSLPEAPTAITCFSDLTAIGVLNCLYDKGLRPGIDMDVLGFDGTYLSECTFPKLSTIEQPAYDIGKCAFNMLYDKITNPDFVTKKVIFSHKMVARGTTRTR